MTGDFVLVAKEVNPVLKELLGHDIEMTALHSHMLDDQPRLFFMHFWANDDQNFDVVGFGLPQPDRDVSAP